MGDYFKTVNADVGLLSDYEDYYDHLFAKPDKAEYIFSRLTNTEPNRKERLELLKRFSLNVVPSGTVEELTESLGIEVFELDENGDMYVDSIDVIVYFDDEINGCGSTKLQIMAACERFPDHFATLHCPSESGWSESFRYYRVGQKEFWVKQTSDDYFRSNKGNISEEVLTTPPEVFLAGTYIDPFPTAVIDFVRSEGGQLYAFDYYPSVPLKGTKIEEYLPAEEVAYQIKGWVQNLDTIREALSDLAGEQEKI